MAPPNQLRSHVLDQQFLPQPQEGQEIVQEIVQEIRHGKDCSEASGEAPAETSRIQYPAKALRSASTIAACKCRCILLSLPLQQNFTMTEY